MEQRKFGVAKINLYIAFDTSSKKKLRFYCLLLQSIKKVKITRQASRQILNSLFAYAYDRFRPIEH